MTICALQRAAGKAVWSSHWPFYRQRWTTKKIVCDENCHFSRTDPSTETSADGLHTWNLQYADPYGNTVVTNGTDLGYCVPNRYATNRAPNGSYTVAGYVYGRLNSSIQYDSTNGQVGGVFYLYDAHNRLSQSTDARNGTTSYFYNAADLATNVTTPVPGNGSPSETTTTLYDVLLRPRVVVQPDNTAVTDVYVPTGELGSQYGSRTYPVTYTYDYAGRMQTMTTWSGFSLGAGSGARVTTWNYDPYRGWLTSKIYADNNGPSYQYTAAGRLMKRIWARGITTSYTNDGAGEILRILYSDGTPAVTNTYDNLGRLVSVVANGMTDSLTYNLAGQPLTESFSGGPLNQLSVTNCYDNFLRRTNLTSLVANNPLVQQAFGYDAASRLQTVNDVKGSVLTICTLT
jgi:YD repeat-containing protein